MTIDPIEQLGELEAADAGRETTPPEGGTPAAETPEETPTPEWEQRGLNSIEDVWQSYQNMERRFQERNDEIGQLREFQRQAMPLLDAAQRSASQPAQPQGQPTFEDGTPMYSFEQLQGWIDNGQMTEFQASAIWADQAARVHAGQAADERFSQVESRFQPLEQGYVNRGTQDALDQLNATFGDDVIARHGELVAGLIRQDRAHYADPENGARRLAEAVALAEYQLQSGRTPTTAPTTAHTPRPVHVEGGSGAAPLPSGAAETPDAKQAIIRELMGDAPTGDRFGAHPVGTDYDR